MNTNQQIFDSIFKTRGGWFNPNPYNENNNVVEETFNDIKSLTVNRVDQFKIQYPLLPEIYFDFIANPALNACATKYGEKYFIGINSGTYFLISNMFLCMFATKNLFVDIGNANIETEAKKVLNVVRDSGNILFDFFNLDPEIYPKDTHRMHFASAYTSLAMDFLILHEICHVLRGHIGLLSDRLSYAKWDETENINDKNQVIDPMLRQVMEMDADSFATNHAYLNALGMCNLNPTLAEPVKSIFKTPKEFFKHWFFVMYSFFRLFGLYEFDYLVDKNKNHPPPSIRMHMAIITISTILVGRKIDVAGELFHLKTSVENAENAFCAITFHDSNIALFWKNYGLGKEYIREISSNWNRAYPLLKPFAFGQLPPLHTE